MKKYRRKNEVLVWKWTGDKSIISEIHESVAPFVTEHVDFSVGISKDKKTLTLSHKCGYSTSNEFVSIGEVIIFDINDDERPFGCYSESYLNKKFVEL